jgi:hypothetical protein
MNYKKIVKRGDERQFKVEIKRDSELKLLRWKGLLELRDKF